MSLGGYTIMGQIFQKCGKTGEKWDKNLCPRRHLFRVDRKVTP